MSKVVSLKKLSALRRGWKSQGLKVVFTNGCFDILHAGHVWLLEQAKRRGDVLVVGLNTDASVRRLKGPSRPLQPQRARAQVLSALSCVDHVVLFDGDTPLSLIRSLKPDLLIKGRDYPVRGIVGREFAERVLRIPLKRGFSTTGLIRKICRRGW